MGKEDAPTGYKLLLVPESDIAASASDNPNRVYLSLTGPPYEVVAETDSVGRLVMSGQMFDSIIVKRGPGGPGKRQRLIWNISFSPPLWTCLSCGSGLVNGLLAHHDSCTEVR